MTPIEIRQKIHQQIEQLLPEQLDLLAEFLEFLQFKSAKLLGLLVEPGSSYSHIN